MTIKSFSIDDIEMFKQDDDVDFAIAKIHALAVGTNSHKNPVSEEVLRRDAHTMLGKFLVAKYDRWANDVTTHENSEAIVGYFPKDSNIEFEEKDGKLFVVYEALVSKLYATDVYKLFKEENFRNVSCEFSCTEDIEDENGEKPITSLFFHGATILGMKYNPSCKGTEMSIVKFSEEDADKFYNEHKPSPLVKFAKERTNMNKKDETVISKVEKLYDKFNLGEEEGDKKMEETKEFAAIEVGSLWSDVYRKLEERYPDTDYGSIYRIEGIYYDNGAMYTIIRRNDENQKYKLDITIDEENIIVFGNEIIGVEQTFVDNGEVKKFEEPEDIDKYKNFEKKVDEDETAEEETTEKEFSLDANLDTAGLLAMLENETEDYKVLATELFEQEDKNIIMSKCLEMYKELSELKQYKETNEAQMAKMAEEAEEATKMSEVEKIMGEVKEDLEEKDFEALKAEGMACKLEQVTQFANKVKAFAYEVTKGKTPKKTDEILKFGFDFNAYGKDKKAISAEDIFNKYK